MNKRQFKKACKKAMQFLISYNPKHYKNAFAQETETINDNVPIGTWMYWYRCDWEYNEWDAEPAFDVLKQLIFSKLVVTDFDVEKGSLIYLSKPDLSSVKKVFDLAKTLKPAKKVGSKANERDYIYSKERYQKSLGRGSACTRRSHRHYW